MANKSLAKRMTILIPFIIIILYFISDDVRSLMTLLPPCLIYSLFDTYCPACGNTRSVTALLHGDLLTSLRFNIVPFLIIIIFVLAYIELATYGFRRHIRLLPRKLSFYIVLIGLLILYFILRNFIPYLTP